MTIQQQALLREIQQRYKRGETAWRLNDIALLLSLLDSDSQAAGDAVCLYVPPIDATELHLTLLCRDCGKPFGEHWQPPVTAPPEAPLRYWVELRSQHAFPVRPQPFVETVEYIRFDLARASAVPRVEKLESLTLDQVKPGEM